MHIITPGRPNFITFEHPSDVKHVIILPMEEFTDAELRAIARQWTAELLADAAKKRGKR